MKGVIVFESKGGSARKCARLLAEKTAFELCDLGSGETVSLAGFDAVIVGSGIRYGKAYKNVLNFLHRNQDALFEKKAGAFICCGDASQADTYLASNFPQAFFKQKACFGGEMDPDDVNGIARFVLKMAMKKAGGKPPVKVHLEEVSHFAHTFTQS